MLYYEFSISMLIASILLSFVICFVLRYTLKLENFNGKKMLQLIGVSFGVFFLALLVSNIVIGIISYILSCMIWQLRVGIVTAEGIIISNISSIVTIIIRIAAIFFSIYGLAVRKLIPNKKKRLWFSLIYSVITCLVWYFVPELFYGLQNIIF